MRLSCNNVIDVAMESRFRKLIINNTFALMLVATMGFILCSPLYASDGDLDPTFGSGGKVITKIGIGYNEGRDVAIQRDGKIVVAGSGLDMINYRRGVGLIRYNTDGTLDASFGIGGSVITDCGNGCFGQAIALQADGKIVVAGGGGWVRQFLVARYSSDGSLDPSFGTDGMMAADFNGLDVYIMSVALQTDSKIVIAGYVYNSATPGGDNWDFALARLNPDGSFDTAFGNSGRVMTDIGGHGDYGWSVAIQSDGKIVVVGGTNSFAFPLYLPDFALVRYNSDGSLDTSFGSGGKVVTDFAGRYDHARSVVIQADGKILVAGTAVLTFTYDFGLARYNLDGTLDTSFGIGGIASVDIAQSPDYANEVALQANGKIVVVGYINKPAPPGIFDYDFALARLNPNGSLDQSFGTNGTVTTDFGVPDDRALAWSVAIQADGKIVAAGYTGSADYSTYKFALARYLSNTPPLADAGADQTVHAGSVVTLNGSGSTDADGNYPLTYAWTIKQVPPGSTAALVDANTMTPKFTTDLLGDYVIELVVTDSVGAPSQPDSVKISTTNTAPVTAAGPDQSVVLMGSTVHLDGSTSYDPDGDAIMYLWSFISKPDGSTAILSNPMVAQTTFVADMYGQYEILLIVSDLFGANTSDTVIISFENVRPVANAGVNQIVVAPSLVQLDGIGSTDANGDPLTYQWSMVNMPLGSSAVLSNETTTHPDFVADLAGQYVVSLTVSDGLLTSNPSNVTITATSSGAAVINILRAAVNAINGLAPQDFKNPNMANALTNKIAAVILLIEGGHYAEALDKLTNDVLAKMNGCAEVGAPDKNDWIINCPAQAKVYPYIINAIEQLQMLI